MNENLRNEIKKVIEKLKDYLRRLNEEDYFDEDIQDYCFPYGVREYVIITSTKKQYIINCITREVPDIDIEDIVHVIKGLYLTTENKYSYWDTINGYYNKWSLFKSTINSFNSTEIIGEFED